MCCLVALSVVMLKLTLTLKIENTVSESRCLICFIYVRVAFIGLFYEWVDIDILFAMLNLA